MPTKEQRREQNHRYYWNNREDYLRRQQERYRQNPAPRRAYSRGYYAEHKEDRQAYAKRRRLVLRTALRWYKQTKGCVDCSETDPLVLDFDHVQGDKRFEIASGIHGLVLSTTWAEIQKCEVVCANCHRRRTYKHLKRRAEWPITEGMVIQYV